MPSSELSENDKPGFTLDLQRLMLNAGSRRDILQQAGLKRLRLKRLMSVVAGLLALASAGTITAVIAKMLGESGIQLLAALAAALSGTISLVANAYLTDDEIVAMLTGSSKYLLLRENLRRIIVHPGMTDEERFERLERFQEEYAELDTAFSRFLPPQKSGEALASQIVR